MDIGGLQKLSLIDYPDKLSAVIWTVGCNLKCPYCYNPGLITSSDKLPEEQVLAVLEDRKDILEGVVVTGGEPSLQKDLVDFLYGVKQMGYLVKLDTNGTRPKVVSKLLKKELVDYIAMDIKASKEKYSELTRTDIDVSKINESIEIIKDSTVSNEFRTTVVPGFLEEKDIKEISKWVGNESRYFLQQFEYKGEILAPDKIYEKAYSEDILEVWCKKYFENCKVRT
ncbi:MAG: anaerobic ribonucleoside-triphosphate reductase activating protein [Thermoplasmatota archaeon]